MLDRNQNKKVGRCLKKLDLVYNSCEIIRLFAGPGVMGHHARKVVTGVRPSWPFGNSVFLSDMAKKSRWFSMGKGYWDAYPEKMADVLARKWEAIAAKQELGRACGTNFGSSMAAGLQGLRPLYAGT